MKTIESHILNNTKYHIVELTEEEKADCERIINEVKEEEGKPFVEVRLKDFIVVRNGKVIKENLF